MTIGEKVKLYRDSHGESQRQFAVRAGVSNTTIGSLEKGINPNTGKPIWVEFKINCQMDQIASAPIWMKYLRNTTKPNAYKLDYEETITDL